MIRRLLSGPAVATGLLWLALLVPVLVGSTDTGATVIEQRSALVMALIVVLAVRRAPVIALAAAVSITLPAAFTENGLWPVGVMVLGSYIVGRQAEVGRAALPAFIGVAVVGVGIGVASGSFGPTITALIIEVLASVLPWWGGTYLRHRSELIEAGWTRAAQLESREELVAEQARVRERAEIAREMHDSLGHELSLLAVSTGALEVTSLTDEQRQIVVRVRETAVRSMAELHDIVNVLRDEHSSGFEELNGRSLHDVVARSRAAGTKVDFVVDGVPDTWSPAVSRAVHRIVQELLTNTAKHAPDAPLTLHVGTVGDMVRIRARNPVGPSVPMRPEGSGLPGMRERVRVLGGTLDVDNSGGQFAVDVSIPVSATPSSRQVPREGSAPSAQSTVHADRRTHTRRTALTAVVPAAFVLVVAGALFATNAITVARSGMEPATFEQIRVGQLRADLNTMLPLAHIQKAPPTFNEPEQPAGAACEYFRPTTNPFVLGSDSLYRLCFADQKLVSKDVVS